MCMRVHAHTCCSAYKFEGHRKMAVTLLYHFPSHLLRRSLIEPGTWLVGSDYTLSSSVEAMCVRLCPAAGNSNSCPYNYIASAHRLPTQSYSQATRYFFFCHFSLISFAFLLQYHQFFIIIYSLEIN